MTKLTPPIIQRPRLAHWLFERGLKTNAAAEALSVSERQVKRYLLPFGDPNRQVPGEEVMRRIVLWTRGEVTPADFYPPELNRPGDPAVLAAARCE